jgi:hypothetical protein
VGLGVGSGVGLGVGFGVGLRVGEGVERPLYVLPLELVNLDAKQLFLFQSITIPPLACAKETFWANSYKHSAELPYRRGPPMNPPLPPGPYELTDMISHLPLLSGPG